MKAPSSVSRTNNDISDSRDRYFGDFSINLVPYAPRHGPLYAGRKGEGKNKNQHDL